MSVNGGIISVLRWHDIGDMGVTTATSAIVALRQHVLQPSRSSSAYHNLWEQT